MSDSVTPTSALIRTRTKICGITRVEDALASANAGADAIGLNFYPASPRCVSRAQARDIVAALPPFIMPVALFVNASSTEVESVIDDIAVDLLQFHGDEDEVFCAQFAMPYLKAIRVDADTDLLQCEAAFPSAAGLLLDTWVDGSFGGTGEVFDWSLIPRGLRKPIVLSGGLTPRNVREAVRIVRPWAVDVSSGVETAPGPKGIKDARKIIEFISEVGHADV